MLHGIDPRVTPRLMDVLMRMGHGDELAVVDANFPAHALAARTTATSPVELPGLDAPQAIALILQLMPLDAFSETCFLRMEMDDGPDASGPVHEQALAAALPHIPQGSQAGSIARQDFYSRARRAFAIVRVSEERPYGCFLLRKGVILKDSRKA